MKFIFSSVIIRELYVFFLVIWILGEVMITQVNSLGSPVLRDPRRKAQSVQFKHRSNIPFKNDYNEQYVQQKNNALWTSISIVGGSLLFMLGYFLFSALKSK